MQRLRPLDEQECYLRPGDDPPEATSVLTERIRLAFEAGLGDGQAEAA